MRVLLVNDAPPGPTGGAEVYLDTLVPAMEAAGDTVEVLAGEVVHHGWRKVLDVWDPGARRLVADRARAFGADLVHHHNVARELSIAVVGATPDLPTVLTLHDHRLLGRGDVPDAGVAGAVHRFVKRPLDRVVARRAVDLAIAVSDALADAARGAGFRRVASLPQPVVGPAEPPRPASTGSSVLFVGRTSHDKGVPELLELARLLGVSHPDVPVEVVGDGPLLDDVRAAASHTPSLVVHGRLDRDGVAAAYDRCRVVVVPSHAARRPEGGSLVAVEAARHARPVVVGTDPAVRSVASPLGHAPETDGSPRALHRAVAGLLDDPGRADALGARGARAATRHDPGAVADELGRLHREVVRERSARSRGPLTP